MVVIEALKSTVKFTLVGAVTLLLEVPLLLQAPKQAAHATITGALNVPKNVFFP